MAARRALSDELLDFEYRQWVSMASADESSSPLLLSLCQVSYMLDPETKSRILLLEVRQRPRHLWSREIPLKELSGPFSAA